MGVQKFKRTVVAPAFSPQGATSVKYGGTGQDLSATGGTSQVLKQNASHVVSVGQLAFTDISGSVALAQLDPVLETYVTGTLTAAQIITLNSVPVQLVASPGSGKVIIPGKLVFEMIPSGTAFQTGGTVSVYAHSGSAIYSGAIPASVVNASGTTKSVTSISAKTETNGFTEAANTGYDLKASADFTVGTGTAAYWFSYKTITLA